MAKRRMSAFEAELSKLSFQEQLDRARALHKVLVKNPYRVVEASYLDPPEDKLALTLQNGVVMLIPRGNLGELAGAPPEALRRIELDMDGICFPDIDVAICTDGLTADMVGARDARQAGRKGGSARTEAKQQAARENGKKGGRPRKEAR